MNLKSVKHVGYGQCNITLACPKCGAVRIKHITGHPWDEHHRDCPLFSADAYLKAFAAAEGCDECDAEGVAIVPRTNRAGSDYEGCKCEDLVRAIVEQGYSGWKNAMCTSYYTKDGKFASKYVRAEACELEHRVVADLLDNDGKSLLLAYLSPDERKAINPFDVLFDLRETPRARVRAILEGIGRSLTINYSIACEEQGGPMTYTYEDVCFAAAVARVHERAMSAFYGLPDSEVEYKDTQIQEWIKRDGYLDTARHVIFDFVGLAGATPDEMYEYEMGRRPEACNG
jgi:hypothetical protein